MNYDDSKGNTFKISLKIIILAITALLIFSSIWMIIYAMRARMYNEKSIELSKMHMRYTDIASDLNLGSNNLTEYVRLFAETGDAANMQNYFAEANDMKHRDKAMLLLSQLPDIPPEAQKHIEASMKSSLELMECEYYSMKLTTLAYSIPDEFIPDIVLDVRLTPEDADLSSDQMKEKARIILFDERYIETKSEISDGITVFLDEMQENSAKQYLELTQKVVMFSGLLRNTIAVVSVLIFLLTLFLYLYVVRPIAKASRNIKMGQKIKMPFFLEEMNALGSSYNDLMDNNEDLVERLKEMAETDTLTKLGNRAAYLNYCNDLKKYGGEVLLFVFDVNDLRETNNKCGHEAGDRLLKRAAESIISTFKTNDTENCFRIGGDEFVAVVRGEDENDADLYIKKFKYEQSRRDIRIAVGYAYTVDIKNESVSQLFSQADKRMYIDKTELKNNR